MRFAVLADPESWYLRDLARAAAAQSHEVTQVAFSQIAAEIGGSKTTRIFSGEHELTEFDAVLVRTMPPGSLEQVVFRMDCLARRSVAGHRRRIGTVDGQRRGTGIRRSCGRHGARASASLACAKLANARLGSGSG